MRPDDGHLRSPTPTISELIKERARKLGFEKVGVVPAQPLEEEGLRLQKWLAANYHGNMSWMARDPEIRSDPRKLFPAARSVVVVALNYYTPGEHTSLPDTGKISRYAWGDDYHDVIVFKTKDALTWIQRHVPSAEGKVCVDIQPIMDKAWAQRAGLGWIGKHTNLITPEYGSWVFIGELLLNIDLDYDIEEVKTIAGHARYASTLVPLRRSPNPTWWIRTSASLTPPLSSVNRTIPDHIGQHLEGWLYGCDICQDVCPWNRFEQVTGESRFQPREGNVNAGLSEVLSLAHDEYAERFRGSAMKRAKLSGLQRNARTLVDNERSSARARSTN